MICKDVLCENVVTEIGGDLVGGDCQDRDRGQKARRLADNETASSERTCSNTIEIAVSN